MSSSCRFLRRLLLALAVAGNVGLGAPAAWAHGFGERYELPLPLGFFLAGAAAVVALSCLAIPLALRLGAERRRLRLVLDRSPLMTRRIRIAAGVLRALSVALFCFVVSAGFLGAQDAFHNIAPIAVWVIWWVGFSFLSALVGNLWPAINPWDALFVWGAGLARRVGLVRRPSFGIRYPHKLGAAPAVILLILFVLAELAWAGAEVPRLLSSALIGYAALSWVGMALFGRRVWRVHGDVFSLYFAILGRFAPLGTAWIGGRKAIVLRSYAVALAEKPPRTRWFAGLVIVMLASVTFDGLSETPLWADVADALRSHVVGLGRGSDAIALALAWVAFLALFALLYGALVRAMSFAARHPDKSLPEVPPAALARRFVLTLVPIAIAYQLAHYMGFLLLAGQYAIPLLSDPLGRGWDLFGTVLYRIDPSIFDAQGIWYFALASIVVGHIIAVVLGHVVAMDLFGSRAVALRSQYPMLIFMIAYTASSLWILAQPIVRTK